MFRIKLTVVALVAFSASALAQTTGVGEPAPVRYNCGANVDTSYVLGINAKVDNGPVAQGWCRATAATGLYGELWVSQSLKRPGGWETPDVNEEPNRFGNEVDITFGVDRKISNRWSYNLNIAHFDIVNPRLFDFRGDIIALAGTLRYHATEHTTIYVNVEDYEGYGKGRFQGGQRLSLALASSFGPVTYDVTLRRNNHIGGNEGQLVKLTFGSVRPIAKIAGGELRPEVMIYKPLGRYADVFDTQVVGRLAITW